MTITDSTDLMTKHGPKITIEVCPGRWGKIFHLFDADGREIALQQKDALKMARQILKEQGK